MQNHISVIKAKEGWFFKRNGIAKCFLKKFNKLYTLETTLFVTDLNNLIVPCISTMKNEKLLKISQVKEIEDFVLSMHLLKNSRPDDFSNSFFRTYW